MPHSQDFCTIEDALADLQAGRMVVLVDDEHRENEGDLVIPAERATPETINFMMRNGCGIVCLAMLILSPFIFRSRQSRYTARSTPIGNVTPLRRNPLNSLVTRWNLFILKMRYRRQNGRK